MIREVWNKVFVNTFREAERKSREYMATAGSKQASTKVVVICCTVAVCLTMNYYFKNADQLVAWWRAWGLDGAADRLNKEVYMTGNSRIRALAYWALFLNIFYFLVPLAVIKFVLKEKLSDYGFGMRSAIKDWRIYALFFGVMFPLVVLFSFTQGFQYKYPFYDMYKGEGLWPYFWVWQVLYLFQFFGLEFFFRGFMVHGLKHRFGFYSVFAMMIPYCMIHFGKPFPETCGAILAGIALGSLSLKSRSIWLGVAIHYSVAITMDLAALWQKGFLGE